MAKVRPPTLRDNRRYVLARYEPGYREFDPKKMYYVVQDAVTGLFGDLRSVSIGQAVMSCEGGFLIVRCLRGGEDDLGAALAAVTAVGDESVAIHPMKSSGTIKTLRDVIKNNQPAIGPILEETNSEGQTLIRREGKKVDVVRRKNMSQNNFYCVSEDMEE